MKIEASMQEIFQNSTTTEPNKYEIRVYIIGSKKECDKAFKAIGK